MLNQKPTRGFTGLWIPAFIVKDERLTLLEKMLYAEIDALDKGNSDDGCFASNSYLANLLGCSADTISGSVNRLVDYGLIASKINRLNGNQRTLSVKSPTLSAKTPIPIGENTDTLSAKTPFHTNRRDNRLENRENTTPLPPVGGGVVEYRNSSVTVTGERIVKPIGGVLPQQVLNILREEGVDADTLQWLGSKKDWVNKLIGAFKFYANVVQVYQSLALIYATDPSSLEDEAYISNCAHHWSKIKLTMPAETRAKMDKYGLPGWIKSKCWMLCDAWFTKRNSEHRRLLASVSGDSDFIGVEVAKSNQKAYKAFIIDNFTKEEIEALQTKENV